MENVVVKLYVNLTGPQGAGIFQLSCSVMSDSLQPHGLQHARPPCPSLTPRACSNACPLSQWYHPTTSSSIVPFSSCLQSFPGSGSFPMSHFFTSGGQNIEASATVLPKNSQDWFPLGLTGLISSSNITLDVSMRVFWIRLTFRSADWIKQIALLKCNGLHLISWRLK